MSSYYNRPTAITNSEYHWRNSMFIIGESKKYGKYMKVEIPLDADVIECSYYEVKAFISFLNNFIKSHHQDPDLFDDDDLTDFIQDNYAELISAISENVELIQKRNNKSNEARNRMVLASYGCSCHSGGYGGHCGTSSSSTGCHSSRGGGHCSSSSSSVSCHIGVGYGGHC